MKVLFVGLGSVGQRHLQNFIKLSQGSNYQLYALRVTDSEFVIKDGKILSNETIERYYNINILKSWEQVEKLSPDIAFVCNPSSQHLETALKLAVMKCHLFIEKPLGTNTSLLGKLKNEIEKNGLITMVGFQSRFHPCVEIVDEALKNNKYGNIISAQFNWATYLPHHHVYEDYRKSYAANKSMGGGVIFCLIHELDLIQCFFDTPIKVYAEGGHLSCLEMDVEDSVSAIFSCNNNYRNIPIIVYLSFSHVIEERFFKILFDEAILCCDLLEHKLKIFDNHGKQIIEQTFKNLKRNDLFISEMKHFLECVSDNKKTKVPVDEGGLSLKMALAIHESLQFKRLVTIS